MESELNEQETRFCEAILQGASPSAAYLAAHPGGTNKPDSVRSLAARFIRRPNVAAYIRAGLQRIREQAAEYGIWSRMQSLVERRAALDAFKADIAERQQRLADAVQRILADETLGDAEKAQAVMRATHTPIWGKATVEAHRALCDALDALTWYSGSRREWFESEWLPYNSPEKVAERMASEAELARQFPVLWGNS